MFKKWFYTLIVVITVVVVVFGVRYNSISRNDRKLIGKIIEHLYQDKIRNKDIVLLKGGHSGNHIYKITKGNENLAIRIHKHSRNENVRKREYSFTKYASEAGFGPQIIYSDEKLSFLATVFSNGYHPNETTFENIDNLKKMAKALKLLHEGPQVLTGRSLLDTVKVRIARVQDKNPSFLQNPEILRRFNLIEKIITNANFPEKLCHYDLREGNILVEDSRVLLIDWETAGMADPYSDIASISVEFAFSPEQEEEFLKYYLNKDKIDVLAKDHLFIMKQLYILRVALEFSVKSGFPEEKEFKRFCKFFKLEGAFIPIKKISRKELAVHMCNVFLKNTSISNLKIESAL